MKVGIRIIPQDELSFEHEGFNVHIYTHRNQIAVSIIKEGKVIHAPPMMTPEQFISLLLRDTQP